MSTIGNRLPPREDLVLVFGGCAFLVHVWAIYNMLDALPAWILRMSAYELAGVISYVLVFALMESLVVWGALILAAVVLPRSWLRLHFISRGMALVLVTAIWSIVVHLYYEDFVKNRELLPILAGGYLVSTLLISYLAGRYSRIETVLRSILDRVIVLSFVYIFFDVLGVFVIISRSVF